MGEKNQQWQMQRKMAHSWCRSEHYRPRLGVWTHTPVSNTDQLPNCPLVLGPLYSDREAEMDFRTSPCLFLFFKLFHSTRYRAWCQSEVRSQSKQHIRLAYWRQPAAQKCMWHLASQQETGPVFFIWLMKFCLSFTSSKRKGSVLGICEKTN